MSTPPLAQPTTQHAEDARAERGAGKLEQHQPVQGRQALRLCTAGSVDDGKSTFVGRLLHDTKSVLTDQLASVERSSADRGFDGIDFSLLVDGLRAEREQGITIDVAYRYFSTEQRSFILADTPGHVQYTRNTVTGMSTSQVVVLLIDVRSGIVEQTRRHLHVAALLGVREVILAVNKIDLIAYNEAPLREIEAEAQALAKRLGIPELFVVPISALKGDNVAAPSEHTPWYQGPTVLELLETIQVQAAGGLQEHDDASLRFPIQYVLRHHASDYRAYAGRITVGSARVGQTVGLPGGASTTITGIDTPDGPADTAGTGASVALQLADAVDLSRGDLITGEERPTPIRALRATLVGLTEQELRAGQMFQLRTGTASVKARIVEIERIVAPGELLGEGAESTEERAAATDQQATPQSIGLNDIARVHLQLASELPLEPYAERGAVGSFLLVHPSSKDTLAAGLVVAGLE